MMDYASFTDESRHMEGRYRSIAAVSLPAELVVEMSEKLAGVIDSEKRRELKWGGVGDRRGKGDVDRAIAAVNFLLEHITLGVRADVLIGIRAMCVTIFQTEMILRTMSVCSSTCTE